jgi:hypothetical protein
MNQDLAKKKKRKEKRKKIRESVVIFCQSRQEKPTRPLKLNKYGLVWLRNIVTRGLENLATNCKNTHDEQKS